jgi:hypothetical protein
MYFACLILFCRGVEFLSLLIDLELKEDSVFVFEILAFLIEEIVGSINFFDFIGLCMLKRDKCSLKILNLFIRSLLLKHFLGQILPENWINH